MGPVNDVRDSKDAIEYVHVRKKMPPPICITPKAARQIRHLLSKEDGVEGLRLTVKTTGCSGNSYKMEYIKTGEDLSADECFEHQSAAIYIPKIYSWMLFGMTVDYITDDLGNARFDFINPNETGRCGCGESFQVEKPEG